MLRFHVIGLTGEFVLQGDDSKTIVGGHSSSFPEHVAP